MSSDTLGWAAVGPTGGDTAYRTQSLRFGQIESELNESISIWTLLRLWFYAAAVSWAVFFVIFFFGLIIALAGSGSSDNADDGDPTSALSAYGTVLTIGWIISVIVFVTVLLIVRIQEPVGEWKTLIEGKAGAAESSYAAIYGSLGRRYIPVSTAAVRVRSDVLANEAVNNRLMLSERSYIAYVSVFAYGTSLYVGWMMWRNRRGVVIIGTFIKDLIGSIFQRSGPINQMLRTEKVRAMREAVHSAVREGVDAAIAGLNVPITSTFGHEIPVQNLTAAAVAAGAAPMVTPPAAMPTQRDELGSA